MSFIPPWAVMPKWQLKLQDWLTSEKTVQDAVDRMFEQPYKIYAKIEGNAVFGQLLIILNAFLYLNYEKIS